MRIGACLQREGEHVGFPVLKTRGFYQWVPMTLLDVTDRCQIVAFMIIGELLDVAVGAPCAPKSKAFRYATAPLAILPELLVRVPTGGLWYFVWSRW
ncbi:MAG: hypothetical protein CSA65_07710 [Proteobacteria bacterium]|nr:MAG: hypothetical protein CSA65_07710 [Pseudomonadota bacterium]